MHEPSYFDSQASAAAALNLDIYDLREAKREGCRAFKSGRVYRDELLNWFEEKRRGAVENGGNEKEMQQLAGNTILWLLKCENAGLLTIDQCFETGKTIVEGTKDKLILQGFVELNFSFLCDNFPELSDAYAAHPKIVDWLCLQGGAKYRPPEKRSRSDAK